MILEQIPSRPNHHFSRNRHIGYTPRAMISLADNGIPDIEQPNSKLLLINKHLQKFYDHQLFGIADVQEFCMIIVSAESKQKHHPGI